MHNQLLIVCTCFILLSGCLGQDELGVCKLKSDEGYINQLSKELTQRNIEHKIKGDNICFRVTDREVFNRTDTYVNSYWNAVATLLDNEEKEERIIAWLKQENKSYKISKTNNSNRLLIIHSTSEKDAESNRNALSKLESQYENAF